MFIKDVMNQIKFEMESLFPYFGTLEIRYRLRNYAFCKHYPNIATDYFLIEVTLTNIILYSIIKVDEYVNNKEITFLCFILLNSNIVI